MSAMNPKEDETDPGMEQLPDGSIIIGPASVRAQLKRQQAEAIEHAQKVIEEINNAPARKPEDD